MMSLKVLLSVSWLLPQIFAAPTSLLDEADYASSTFTPSSRQLQGRFLHITDLHPDEFYKVHASTAEENACHKDKGTAGYYGAETSDCDTPHALINATFKWIADNVKDTIDFVVWTGDSARHDSDEDVPRSADQVLNSNRYVAAQFAEVFKSEEDPNELAIPIVATFGNNDILPHNILLAGPNKWLKAYTNIWNKYIPEEQRHGFERGGWYYVEVIPGKLAVFSLNTLYFFDNNAAVDGCALKSEPGYEHMEWLRIQLQFMRERGMKAILMGHVPPARTDSKRLWDETCWQKYTLWLKQYRDVVVGGLYGHMNIDHFMLHDTKDVDIAVAGGLAATAEDVRTTMDDELTIESANDYLEELRSDWSDLPNPSVLDRKSNGDGASDDNEKNKKKKSKKQKEREKAEKKLGGPWGERFVLTHVAPSVVPNYFPTIRIIEYNISGVDKSAVWANPQSWSKPDALPRTEEKYDIPTGESASSDVGNEYDELAMVTDDDAELLVEDELISQNVFDDILGEHISNNKDKKGKKDKKKKKKKKKEKKPKTPDLHVPDPPSETSPPGPAYSPQSLTLLGYTQYFANLTHINNDFVKADKWREGKHKGKHPKDSTPKPKPFKYEVEYSTFTDPVYKLKDMTVKSYIKLAHRIGQYKPMKGDSIDKLSEDSDVGVIIDEKQIETEIEENDQEVMGKKKDKKKDKKRDKKKQKKKQQHKKNKPWLQFIKRAFVGTVEDHHITELKHIPESEVSPEEEMSHDGEL